MAKEEEETMERDLEAHGKRKQRREKKPAKVKKRKEEKKMTKSSLFCPFICLDF